MVTFYDSLNVDIVCFFYSVGIFASAGRHQTCLPSWRKESSARVYARYVSSEILWGSKDKHFLGHFLLGIFIQVNLLVNLKQEVQLISQLLSGTERKKRPVLSIEVVHPATWKLQLLLCLYIQGQIMLKVHGNLNKRVSENMKLNW